MRVANIGGILLIAFGIAVLVLGLSYPESTGVFEAGDFSARIVEHRSVPDWVGISSVALGVILLAATGLRRMDRPGR